MNTNAIRTSLNVIGGCLNRLDAALTSQQQIIRDRQARAESLYRRVEELRVAARGR